jgi:hypothetical protein
MELPVDGQMSVGGYSKHVQPGFFNNLIIYTVVCINTIQYIHDGRMKQYVSWH